MKGLILKDLYYIKQNIKILLAFLVIYTLVFFKKDSIPLYSIMIPMVSGFMVLGSMTDDEKNGWNRYASTFPINKNEIILSKYIIINFFTILIFLITLFIPYIAFEVNDIAILLESFLLNYTLIFMLNLTIFFNIKYGVEKAKIYVMSTMISIGVGAYIIYSLTYKRFTGIYSLFMEMNPLLLGILGFSLIIVIITLSFIMSCKIIKNKEF